ncbi:hypothetical protein [Xylanimonas sp. McL0601]|uniref:hypothetical protein n=1 Tax=Xylanimonas sp. McL0601 TaxID=3414739 RepID=UPI003CF6E9FF
MDQSSTPRSTRNRRIITATAVLAVGVLVLAACAAGANPELDTPVPGSTSPAGFWLGLWHGFILPITFIVSLFTDNVSVYEVHNSGNWYDVGFVLGLLCSVGGAAGGSSRRRG